MAAEKKAAAGAESAASAEVALAEGIVAPGRTVRACGVNKGPGETVELPEAEISYLRAMGFILPDAQADEVGAASTSPAVIRPR
ncbi:MAG TPA: hypothetical protein VFG62_08740 [Rhodopila sp.]|jgi:hypothetical protein|nr:hypothetical protein [Rhodopila sp.]